MADTPIGPHPGGAFFLVDWLTEQGQPATAEDLRRALWQLQLAAIRGEPAEPQLTLGQAIARGATLPPQGREFTADWQHAYSVSTTLIFRPEQPRASYAAVPLPAGLPDAAGLHAIEAGLWAQPREHGSRYVLAVDLRRDTPASMAPQGLRLRLGGERDGVVFNCLSYPPPTGSRARERERFHSGDTRGLACETFGDNALRERLPELLRQARERQQPAALLPRAPADPPAGERAYWKHNPYYERLKAAWAAQRAMADDPANRRRAWAPGAKPLEPPQLVPLPPTWSQRAAIALQSGRASVVPVLTVMALSWALFGVVRVLMREASDGTRAAAVIAIAAFVTLPFVMMQWRGSQWGGDGWSNLGTLVSGLLVLQYGGAIATGALVLQALYRVLDADGIGWGHAIANGWRRMLHMGGDTSRGEFWGFVAFAMLALIVSGRLGRPWPAATFCVLMVPTATLAVRRMTSLTPAEFGTGLLIILLFLVEHLVG